MMLMEIEGRLFGPGQDMIETVQKWATEADLEDLRLVESVLVELIAQRRWQIAGILRGRGYSWSDVGKSLGISAQRAHLAYGPDSQGRYGPAGPGLRPTTAHRHRPR